MSNSIPPPPKKSTTASASTSPRQEFEPSERHAMNQLRKEWPSLDYWQNAKAEIWKRIQAMKESESR